MDSRLVDSTVGITTEKLHVKIVRGETVRVTVFPSPIAAETAVTERMPKRTRCELVRTRENV
eukprot:5100381-Amphidinium_carterae.1